MTNSRRFIALGLITLVPAAVIATVKAASDLPIADGVKHVAYAVSDLPLHRSDKNGGYRVDTRLLLMWVRAEIGRTPGFAARMLGPLDVPNANGIPSRTLFVKVTATPDAHKQLTERFDELRNPMPEPDPMFSVHEFGQD